MSTGLCEHECWGEDCVHYATCTAGPREPPLLRNGRCTEDKPGPLHLCDHTLEYCDKHQGTALCNISGASK